MKISTTGKTLLSLLFFCALAACDQEKAVEDLSQRLKQSLSIADMATETIQASEGQLKANQETLAKDLLDQGIRSIEVRWSESEPVNLFSSVSSILSIANLYHGLRDTTGRDEIVTFVIQKIDQRGFGEDRILSHIRVASRLHDFDLSERASEQFQRAASELAEFEQQASESDSRTPGDVKRGLWLALGQFQGEAGFYKEANMSFDAAAELISAGDACSISLVRSLVAYTEKLKQGLAPSEARDAVEWDANCTETAP